MFAKSHYVTTKEGEAARIVPYLPVYATWTASVLVAFTSGTYDFHSVLPRCPDL